MATSLKTNTIFTEKNYHGASAPKLKPIDELKRTIMCYMLFENAYYESGESIAQRIENLVPQCKPQDVIDLALYAKGKGKLRHAPLFLIVALLKTKQKEVSLTAIIGDLITRSDELLEILAIYWREGKKPLPAQLKKALSKSFGKFNEFQLSKVPDNKQIKLRDIIRLTHPVPENEDQSALWKKVISGELKAPDSWQVRLSAGQDKKEAWNALIIEKKLGALDVLRNIRNMLTAGIAIETILKSIDGIKTERILPFQFVSAYRNTAGCTSNEIHGLIAYALQQKMFECVKQFPVLPGRTLILVDVSGSMAKKISSKSDLKRIDAAAGVAIIAQNLCQVAEIACFNTKAMKFDSELTGFQLANAFNQVLGGGTDLRNSLNSILQDFKNRQVVLDRIVVFTDEQSDTDLRRFQTGCKRNYLINVASNKNGIAYDINQWVQISGFSEAVVQFISEYEAI